MSSIGKVPVVVVTGPVGVGKSTVVHEADRVLIESGSRHATVEMEEIARYCPPPGPASWPTLWPTAT
jgi:adenylate kinase